MLTNFDIRTEKPYMPSLFALRKGKLISKVESMLEEVIAWNNELDAPIIIALKDNAIRKLIRCFFYASVRPVALGFAGETASGKTTIANELIKALQGYAARERIENFITKINMDNYYYDRSEEVKKAGSFAKFVENYDLDSPSAFELDLFAKHLAQLKTVRKCFCPNMICPVRQKDGIIKSLQNRHN